MLRLLAFAFVSLGFAMMALAPASAQNAEFYTASYVEVGPVLAKVGVAALRSDRDDSRKDQGNISIEVLQRIDRPNQFVVLGVWTSQMAYEAHSNAEHTKKLHDKRATMLAAPIDTRQHHALSVAPAKAGKDPIVVVTHIDVIPSHKDEMVPELVQLADVSRKQAGNVQFDVWQQVNRPNHFTLVEAWANHGAFGLHQMQKESRAFRAKLGPVSGALYDERLYKVLN
jgi:quinol monooxygenase YgiN